MPDKRYVVCADIGHGGKDPGAVANGLLEKDVILKLGKKLIALLGAEGYHVAVTRMSDIDISLQQRVALANEINADLFISLHVNAGGGTGFESYRYPGSVKGQQLQTAIHKHVAPYLQPFNLPLLSREAEQPTPSELQAIANDYFLSLPDRGQKASRFYVLKYTKMPAVLLENLFIDNPTDSKYLKDDTFLNVLAQAIAMGIMEYAPQENIEDVRKERDELRKQYQKLKADYDRAVQVLGNIGIQAAPWVLKTPELPKGECLCRLKNGEKP